MGKIAMLFPGQGAQFVGMGLNAHNHFTTAQAIYNRADQVEANLSTLCFNGPLEELSKTSNTQPCIFTTELALVAALSEQGIIPDGLAGFSLGEITGLVVSDILTLEEGLQLVLKRGQAMAKAAADHHTIMIAVLKLDNQDVEKICQQFSMAYPVNYNCPGQLVVALLKEDQAAFVKAIKTAGGRGIVLNVAGGFHSPFMSSASLILQEDLQNLNFQPASIALYSNTDGRPYPLNKNDIIRQVINHINHPVLWEKTIRHMIDDGFDQFIEVGPGKTLSGFMKKIDPTVSCSHVDDLLKGSTEI